MVNRIIIEADPARVLISKPGQEVTNPLLADNQKIFDSDWFFAGQMIMCKYVTVNYPAGPYPAGQVDFIYPRALGYSPSGMVYRADPVTGGIDVFPVTGTSGIGVGFKQPGRGNWYFMTDRVRNSYPSASSGGAMTLGYLIVTIGAA